MTPVAARDLSYSVSTRGFDINAAASTPPYGASAEIGRKYSLNSTDLRESNLNIQTVVPINAAENVRLPPTATTHRYSPVQAYDNTVQHIASNQSDQ